MKFKQFPHCWPFVYNQSSCLWFEPWRSYDVTIGSDNEVGWAGSLQTFGDRDVFHHKGHIFVCRNFHISINKSQHRLMGIFIIISPVETESGRRRHCSLLCPQLEPVSQVGIMTSQFQWRGSGWAVKQSRRSHDRLLDSFTVSSYSCKDRQIFCH